MKKKIKLETREELSYFLMLPPEAREEIINYLSPFDFYAASITNETFRKQTWYIWNRLFAKEFPGKTKIHENDMWNYFAHYLPAHKNPNSGLGYYYFKYENVNATFRPIANEFIVESRLDNDWIFQEIVSFCYLKFKSVITSNINSHNIVERRGSVSNIIIRLFELGFEFYLSKDDRGFPIRQCILCENKAEFICENCPVGVYCSNECQKKDWETHKNSCY
jgi:hypothetical protein